MKLILLPKLETFASIQFIIGLWNHPDIMKRIKHAFYACPDICLFQYGSAIPWKEIEDKVLELLSIQYLPEILKDKIQYLIKPIGEQIFNWLEAHSELLFRDDNSAIVYLNHIRWSSLGRIDWKSTAELIIEDDGLEIERRFELACHCCLEDLIPVLWKKMKQDKNENNKRYDDEYENEKTALSLFWKFFARKGRIPRLNMLEISRASNRNVNVYFLHWSVKFENFVAFQYFWEKLTKKQKQQNVVRCAVSALEYYSDFGSDFEDSTNDNNCRTILVFLLSYANEKHLKEVCRRRPYEIFQFIHNDWLYQDFFEDVLQHVADFLPHNDYKYFISLLINQIENQSKYYGKYEKMFRAFWEIIPLSCEQTFSVEEWVYKFMKINDDVSVQLIISHKSHGQRKAIMDYYTINRWFVLKIKEGEISVVQHYISIFLESDSEIDVFKKKFLKIRGEKLCLHFIDNDKWLLMMEFINWCRPSATEMYTFKRSLLKQNGHDICRELLMKGNFQLLELFLSWCFTSAQEMEHFKMNFFKIHGRALFTTLLSNNSLEILEKTVIWKCASEEEVVKFKSELVLGEMGKYIYIELLTQNQMTAIDELLKFCSLDEKESRKFRQELMLSEFVVKFYRYLVYSDCSKLEEKSDKDKWLLIRNHLAWHQPTEDTVAQFKSIFKRCLCEEDSISKYFFHLLDEITQHGNEQSMF